MADRVIIDSHHHLWDLSRFPYRWLRPEAPPRPFGDHTPIKRDYLVEDYRRDCASLRLLGSVHVQANSGAARPADETAWLQSLSVSTGTPAAVVGHADLTHPEVERDLDEHCSHPVARGIRMLLGWHEQPKWRFVEDPRVLESQAFHRGFRLLAPRRLAFDVVVMPGQLAQVAALARAFPDTTIVIDHLGMAYLPDDVATRIWRDGMQAAAASPNVFVKVSGLWPLERSWAPARLGPEIRFVVEKFGPSRCMWGSNLPIEKLMCPVDRQIAVLEEILAPLGPDALDWIFRRTAAAVYRL